MSDSSPGSSDSVHEQRCVQCGTRIQDLASAVTTDEGVFCPSCFQALEQQLRQFQRGQEEGINYPSAAIGGIVGGALGAVVWWGFTVVTKISFGLVAVVIGYFAGHGVVRMSGGKRSRGLQGLAVGIAGVAYFYAQYLVSRTFILRYLRSQESEDPVAGLISLPIFPDPELWIDVVSANFGMFDFLFLAIVVYQAWAIPAPLKMFGRR